MTLDGIYLRRSIFRVEILTRDKIKALLHFDPSIEDVEQRAHPSDDINNVYRLVGFGYKKKKTKWKELLILLIIVRSI
jgi:hypothetical protein